jgi:hypothetical protein
MKLDFYKQKNSIFLVTFYLIALICAFINLGDFGIHIEEKFHRLNGLYWLNYISKIFGLIDLQNITNNKINEIGDYTLNPVSVYNKYGVVLDLPAAFLEILFNIENVASIYYYKHFLSFIIFLISSFFFYKILNKRYNNFFISFVGLFLYVTSPRILGDSFLYKDILFLSFLTISLFFLLEAIDKLNLKNLIFFALFSALAINLRVFAILLPFFFITILLIKNFYENDFLRFSQKILIYLFYLFLFTYIFWPYLWASPLTNFVDLFISLKDHKNIVNIKILYSGNYIPNIALPDTYIINWIAISSPLLQTVFFLFGYIYYLKRFLNRFLKINTKFIYNDLWRGKGEQIDFIFFLIFTVFFIIFIFTHAPLYNGWRLVYFFNIFIIYFGISFLNILFKISSKYKFKKFIFLTLVSSSIMYNIFSLYLYHPYQSIYFNSFLNEKTKNNFEGDYHGLSAKHFFEKIDKLDSRKKLKIAVASHTPLQRGLESFSINLQKKFEIVGQEYQSSDYIFRNNISEVNSKLNNKYEIPKNFSKIYEHKINKISIYEIYKLIE